MAKKTRSESPAAADEIPYQRKKKAEPLTTADLRQWAGDLEQLAAVLRDYATSMESLNSPSIKMFKKSIPNAIDECRGWMAGQLLPRIAKVAGKQKKIANLKLDLFVAEMEAADDNSGN
jgi:hypothetical protein